MRTTFQAGGMTIHRLVEMEYGGRPALEFHPNLTPELLAENRDWLVAAGVLDAQDRIVLCFQSYVVVTPHHTVLVDSCIGNGKDRPARPRWHRKSDRAFMDGLAAVGLRAEDIDVVMCTHLHVDHVGWNTRLEDGRWVPTFPNARYLFSARELAFWTERHAASPIPHLADSVLPVVAAGRAELVGSGHRFSEHVRLMPTPGHTVDHFAVALGQGRDAAVITGDLIHTPLQARHPGLRMVLDHDPGLAARTRSDFLERYCGTDTLCCFAHFPSPSAGRVRRWGGGFRCDYVS